MKVASRLGIWQDHLTGFIQVLVYCFAYELPFDPPLIRFSKNAFICLITGNLLFQVVVGIFQAALLEVLKVKQIEVSQVAILLVNYLVRWWSPCLIFLAIAKYSPEDASYSSLLFILLSGILIALFNTALVVVSDKEFGKTAIAAAYSLFALMALTMAITIWTNYSRLTAEIVKMNSSLYETVAVFYSEGGQDRKALTLCEEAIAINPKSASAYNSRACVYQTMHKDAEAIADCNKSLSIKPDAHTYVTRGFSFGQLGNREAQFRDYNAAILLAPRTASAYWYRAKAFEKQGDIASAQKDRDTAKSLGFIPDAFIERQLK